MVTELTPACLRLTGPFEASRGYVACVSLAAAVGLTLLFLTALIDLSTGRTVLDTGLAVMMGGYSVCALIGWICAYRFVFSPIQETTLISRSLRRIYVWEKRTGWTSVDFDRAHAYVGNFQVVTTTGAGAAYPLRVVEIEPDTRRIIKGVALTAPFDRPEPAAQLWEFVRLYMDGEPAMLPPVTLVPDCRVNAYAWMDLELFPYAIDRHHRLVRPFAFWFFSGAYYLPNWMEYWIRRFGRRPALPPELAAVVGWQGESPYRIAPPTQEELAARAGNLPSVKRRWRLASIFGLALWVVLPLFFVGVVVSNW
ncbi:MAG: hypothetical protein J0I68_06200 [Achromobacter sp.]|jgi:hypothetical protein|nr:MULTISPECIES: hypothetical protein [Achromobacter]MBN9638106.1 hypothetical protein [Achromobacter sp.]MCG2599905.1 hypothetical protein [Achromobacter sp.]MCG2604223.1 hypothetical protein [Achromobacter sp.]